MTPEEHRAKSSKGGKAAHAKGTAYQWTSAEASAAAAKAGRMHSVAYLTSLGRRGGLASAAKRRAQRESSS